MVASQQSHIAELVQRNTTLDQVVKKQRDQIKTEQARAEEAISQLRERWRAERAEWERNLELVQSAHRVNTLRVACELVEERARVSEERRKRKALLELKNNLDFVVIQWQARESELEGQVFQLELELEDLKAEKSEGVEEMRELWEEERAELEGQVADLETEVAEKDTEIATLKVNNVFVPDRWSCLLHNNLPHPPENLQHYQY